MIPVKKQLHNVVKENVSRQSSNRAEYAVRNEAGIELWVRTYKRVQVQVPNHVMRRLQR